MAEVSANLECFSKIDLQLTEMGGGGDASIQGFHSQEGQFHIRSTAQAIIRPTWKCLLSSNCCYLLVLAFCWCENRIISVKTNHVISTRQSSPICGFLCEHHQQKAGALRGATGWGILSGHHGSQVTGESSAAPPPVRNGSESTVTSGTLALISHLLQ